jgi:glycosyltransferase involved in cell wall biosynthesis
MSRTPRLVRITTVPISLHLLLTGQPEFFRDQGFEVLTISADGPEVKFLQERGINHRVVPMTRKITPLKDLHCLLQLIRIFRAVQPDLVHTHTPKAGLLGMMAAWITGVPVRMHTVAGLPLMEATGWQKRVLWLTEWLTYRCATSVHPNSKGLLDYLHVHFVGQRARFSLIGQGSSNGIDVAFFTPTAELQIQALNKRKELSIPEGAFVFAFVGRLVGDKGIHELVQAFTTLALREPAIQLLLVGPFEDERDPVQPAVKEVLQQHSRIHAVGFQFDVRPWLLVSDVFVFPSYREGFPNVVMQAACLGRPCIVSDINGCNELVRGGESGWLVPPKDTEALALAMSEAFSRPDLRAAFAESLRQQVTKRYDRAAVWAALLAKYRSLLNFA